MRRMGTVSLPVVLNAVPFGMVTKCNTGRSKESVVWMVLDERPSNATLALRAVPVPGGLSQTTDSLFSREQTLEVYVSP